MYRGMNNKKKLTTLKDFDNEFVSNEAIALTKLPNKKNFEKGKFNVGSRNSLHQVDLLFFPETTSEYKYVLVVCDVGTNHIGAEPMKTKDSATTLAAYKIILRRKVLKHPILIMSDGGGEFKKEFQKYLTNNNIGHQITSRHRQLTPVDRICALLGKYLNKVILSEELKTGKLNVNAWKKHLGKLVAILNESYTKTPVDVENLDPDIKGKSDVIDIDTKVRISLEKPIEYVTGKQLFGKFRASDIRWSKQIYTIYQILLNPSQPIMYLLKDANDKLLKDVAFTAFELQVVK